MYLNDYLAAEYRTLFEYWFIQYDFPNKDNKPYSVAGGELAYNSDIRRRIPSNWMVYPLKQFVNIFTGKKDVSKVVPGPYTFFSCAPDPLTSDEYIYDGEIILVSGNGSYTGRVTYFNGQADLYQRTYGLTLKDGMEWLMPFLYPYMKYAFEPMNSGGKHGSAIPYIVLSDLADFPIVFEETIVKDFVDRMRPILIQLFDNKRMCGELERLKTELLPLLMNGQVSVKPLNNHFVEWKRMLSSAFSKPRCMKEELIKKIMEEMDCLLCEEHVQRLREAVQAALEGYTIERVLTDKERQREDNEQLLNAFLSAKKVEGCSEKTLDYYRVTLAKMLAETEKRIPEISTNDLRQYLSDFKEKRGSSKVTIDNIRRIFSSFFSWLEDEDYITKNPVRRIHRVRADSLVKEIISDESMEILRDSCTEMRDLAMIDLLASTGMRVGELVRMNIADIDFQERQCVVFGKGNKERTVYFNARTKIHLSNYIVSRKDSNPALFVSLSEPFNRLSISGVEKRLRFIGSQVNIARVHPHKFRRTLATTAIDRGMPIEQVQKLLGHVKIDTTLHYAMVGQNNVKNSHRKFIC